MTVLFRVTALQSADEVHHSNRGATKRAKRRAKNINIFSMATSLFTLEPCQNRARTSVTAVTFQSFFVPEERAATVNRPETAKPSAPRLTALPSSPTCRVLGRHPLVCRTAR
jgi:hypothetical protein